MRRQDDLRGSYHYVFHVFGLALGRFLLLLFSNHHCRFFVFRSNFALPTPSAALNRGVGGQ